MRVAKILLLSACALLVTVPVLAQGNPTGSLAGRVSNEGEAVGGVTVSVSSPNLQGLRTTVTTDNGDYIFQFLPPGDYEVTFEMQGFQSVTRSVKINTQQATRLEVPMSLEAVSEEIVVTGTYETISSTPQASTTYTAKVIEELPIARTVAQATILAPGVHDTGPGDNITISGAQSHENLFMVNGVVVNENLRGQPLDLFIEDAVQETTVSTSGISAEFGRFAGGIVNAITRSGGNEFSGTFRSSYTNDSWNGETPLTTAQLDKTVPSYEATLGGPLWKDRVWFFLAGRDRENLVQAFTAQTLIPFEAGADQQRYEGKLTFSVTPQHTFRGTYQEIDQIDVGNRFGNILDLDSVINRETPQELKAATYTGILTSNLFVEAQYSERQFTFIGSGSPFTDLERGTLMLDRARGNARFHSPTFCGVCDPEKRDNENVLGKGSYFLSTESLGSHDLIAGYDRFNDRRFSNNHQSGSDFRVFATRTIITNDIFPVFTSDGVTIIQANPILLGSRGADFQTDSAFFNDKWQLNERWSFNVGVRYDKNDGRDGEGKLIAKDDNISPRLGLSWDVQGDGDWIVNASYGKYVTSISNGIGDATSTGGTPATFQYFYRGPAVNTGTGPLLPTEDALRILFDWFFATNPAPFFANIPGGNTRIDGTLNSPNAQEYVVGVAKRLGTRGFLRADVVHREFGDFYSSRIDLSTGQVDTAERPLRPRADRQHRRGRAHLRRVPDAVRLPRDRQDQPRRQLHALLGRGQLQRRDAGLRPGHGRGRGVPRVQGNQLEQPGRLPGDRPAPPRPRLGHLQHLQHRPPLAVGQPAAELLLGLAVRCRRHRQPVVLRDQPGLRNAAAGGRLLLHRPRRVRDRRHHPHRHLVQLRLQVGRVRARRRGLPAARGPQRVQRGRGHRRAERPQHHGVHGVQLRRDLVQPGQRERRPGPLPAVQPVHRHAHRGRALAEGSELRQAGDRRRLPGPADRPLLGRLPLLALASLHV